MPKRGDRAIAEAEAAQAAAQAAATMPCWLCARPLGAMREWHHPVPKARGGRERVAVHPICHRTLHATFTNADLARFGAEVARLRAAPAIATFLTWMADKPADFHAPTRRPDTGDGRGGRRGRR